jgi:hypothetical protein
LLPSSLASNTLLVVPGMRFSRTNGVLPTKFSRTGYITWRDSLKKRNNNCAAKKLHGDCLQVRID